MKIAIAIPVKDEEPRIEDLLKSLKGADVDLIAFYDDYSTDETVEVVISNTIRVQAPIRVYDNIFPSESTRMSEKRNIILQNLKSFDYILFNDADERFDPYFLANIRTIIAGNDPCLSFAFRRVNLPGAFNYPDLQARLVKNNVSDIEWRGEVHDQLFSKSRNKALVDFVGELKNIISDSNEYYCLELEKYPMIHLPRRTDSLRPWW